MTNLIEEAYKAWEDTIIRNFPTTIMGAKMCLGAMVQMQIEDAENPVPVIIVDRPSSSKTTILNYFNIGDEYSYLTDNFTPASFVSHAANVKKEELENVDMLKQIKDKVLILPDLASVFKDKEEDLKAALGVFTRVLDGDGYMSNSGIHGKRGHKGDCNFVVLGATTPLKPTVWKVMGGLGSRLLFYNTFQEEPTKEDRRKMLRAGSMKKKRKECTEATRNLIEAIKTVHPEVITWDRDGDPDDYLDAIGLIAKLLSKLRFTEEESLDGESDSLPEFEYRLTSLFYNFTRGCAVSQGRLKLNDTDIGMGLELAINSAPQSRCLVLKAILENGGSATSNQITQKVGKSQNTVDKARKSLEKLDLIRAVIPTNRSEQNQYELKPEYKELTKFYLYRRETNSGTQTSFEDN